VDRISELADTLDNFAERGTVQTAQGISSAYTSVGAECGKLWAGSEEQRQRCMEALEARKRRLQEQQAAEEESVKEVLDTEMRDALSAAEEAFDEQAGKGQAVAVAAVLPTVDEPVSKVKAEHEQGMLALKRAGAQKKAKQLKALRDKLERKKQIRLAAMKKHHAVQVKHEVETFLAEEVVRREIEDRLESELEQENVDYEREQVSVRSFDTVTTRHRHVRLRAGAGAGKCPLS